MFKFAADNSKLHLEILLLLHMQVPRVDTDGPTRGR